MTPFEIADRFVDDYLALSPMTCTSLGMPGADDRWDDLSLDGVARTQDLLRGCRAEVAEHLEGEDEDEDEGEGEDQRHAARVLTAFLDTEIGEHESGDYLYDLNHIHCGFSTVRDIFDIMSRELCVGLVQHHRPVGHGGRAVVGLAGGAGTGDRAGESGGSPSGRVGDGTG